MYRAPVSLALLVLSGGLVCPFSPSTVNGDRDRDAVRQPSFLISRS